METTALPIGIHLVGKLSDCDQSRLVTENINALQQSISAAIGNYNNITELGSHYHRFDNGSFTAVVALAESHLSIHTWPEFGTVYIDLFTCNYSGDHTASARRLFDEIAALFSPAKIEKQEIPR